MRHLSDLRVGRSCRLPGTGDLPYPDKTRETAGPRVSMPCPNAPSASARLSGLESLDDSLFPGPGRHGRLAAGGRFRARIVRRRRGPRAARGLAWRPPALLAPDRGGPAGHPLDRLHLLHGHRQVGQGSGARLSASGMVRRPGHEEQAAGLPVHHGVDDRDRRHRLAGRGGRHPRVSLRALAPGRRGADAGLQPRLVRRRIRRDRGPCPAAPGAEGPGRRSCARPAMAPPARPVSPAGA